MCSREQFSEVIGIPPVLWLHNIWAGSAVALFVYKPENTLMQFEVFFTFSFFYFLSSTSLFPASQSALFLSPLLHPRQYIYVHSEAKTSPDSGNSWHTLVASQYNTETRTKKFVFFSYFFMSGLFSLLFYLNVNMVPIIIVADWHAGSLSEQFQASFLQLLYNYFKKNVFHQWL